MQIANSVRRLIAAAPFFRLLLVESLLLSAAHRASADDPAALARRDALRHSYGFYAFDKRTPQDHIDNGQLLAALEEVHANTYNWLISHSEHDWDDLRSFLPIAREHHIRVWVTLLPPSESPPKSKHFSEPFRLDFEKWAAELAALSARQPALVAWSVDDFAYNLKSAFTPEKMRAVIAAQRKNNPKLAFVPCVYFKQASPTFAKNYGLFLDGILFPYRSESTTAGLTDAAQVAPEVQTLKERFGADFPVIVDIYATRHSRLGASTPHYVEQVMNLAYPAADGVHIYKYQDKHAPNEREKHDIIQRVMGSWNLQ